VIGTLQNEIKKLQEKNLIRTISKKFWSIFKGFGQSFNYFGQYFKGF